MSNWGSVSFLGAVPSIAPLQNLTASGCCLTSYCSVCMMCFFCCIIIVNVILMFTKITHFWQSLSPIYELVFKKSFTVVEEKKTFHTTQVTLTCPSVSEVFGVVILGECLVEILWLREREIPLGLGPAAEILLITKEKAIQETHQVAGVAPHFPTPFLHTKVSGNKCIVHWLHLRPHHIKLQYTSYMCLVQSYLLSNTF